MRNFTRVTGCGGSSLLMLLVLAGCGGGGGGGGSTPLVYSGNTSAAVVVPTNASKLVANILGSGDTAGIIAGSSIESDGSGPGASGGVSDLTRRLSRAFRDALARVNRAGSAQGVVPGLVVNETVPCDGGSGSIRTTGTLSDTDGTGTLTLTFNNCLIGTARLGGTATARVDMVDLGLFLPTDLTIRTSRLTIRGPGISGDSAGSVRVQSNLVTDTETITDNLVTLNNFTRGMTRSENLVSVNMYDSILFPSSIISGTVSGRIYDSVHGFVDVSTLVPFTIANLAQIFPNMGQIRLAGNATAILVTALSSTRVQLQFDTDGDNIGDGFAALMNWTDLSGPVGADIGDMDMDGMHNSWETVNGLIPNVDDSMGNPDLDAPNNLQEYQAGTDPNVP